MRVTGDADLMRHIDARRYVMMHTCGPLAASVTLAARTNTRVLSPADSFDGRTRLKVLERGAPPPPPLPPVLTGHVSSLLPY
jgi:hypothetical protein